MTILLDGNIYAFAASTAESASCGYGLLFRAKDICSAAQKVVWASLMPMKVLNFSADCRNHPLSDPTNHESLHGSHPTYPSREDSLLKIAPIEIAHAIYLVGYNVFKPTPRQLACRFDKKRCNLLGRNLMKSISPCAYF